MSIGPWIFDGQHLEYHGGGNADGVYDGPTYGDTSYLQDLIRRRENFTFLRLGDMDWNYITNREIVGRDDKTQVGSPELQRDLQRILLEPKKDILIGSARIVAERPEWREACERWLHTNNVKMKWYDESVKGDAARAGRLQPLVDDLNTRRLVIVGPAYLSDIKFLNWAHVIETPPKNAYAKKDELLEQIKTDAKANPDTIYLLSVAMTAKVLAYEAHGWGTMIDCGALWHPYIGRRIRGWHHRPGLETLKEIKNA